MFCLPRLTSIREERTLGAVICAVSSVITLNDFFRYIRLFPTAALLGAVIKDRLVCAQILCRQIDPEKASGK